MTVSNSIPARSRGKKPVESANGEAVATSLHVVIPRIEPQIIELEVVGISPLVVHAWSSKARNQILDKQMKKAKGAREAKDPQKEYLDALYVSTEGWTGIPAGGVKGALVNACRAVADVPMTLAKRMIFVLSQGRTANGQELVRIYGEHEMHEGFVRIDHGKTADIRFRPMYREWSMKLEIAFLENLISAEQVANLVELAGFIEGVCEHRPGSRESPTGSWGRFRVKREGE